jgi:hypothetical protein
MSPKELAGNIQLDCGAELGEGGWEHVPNALPHVKFHGSTPGRSAKARSSEFLEDDCSLGSLDASYAELTASFAALRLFRGLMMSRWTSGWTFLLLGVAAMS